MKISKIRPVADPQVNLTAVAVNFEFDGKLAPGERQPHDVQLKAVVDQNSVYFSVHKRPQFD